MAKQSPGRYTVPGSVVFYLSRSPKTAAIEAGGDPDKPRLFLQKYHLDLPSIYMIMLDTELEQRAPYLNFLLLESEYLPNSSPLYPYPYRATQFLAYLCHRRHILAIEYPSIRGGFKDDPSAINLVILGTAIAPATNMAEGEPFEYTDAA